MNDLWSADANIQTAMLEAISEGVSGGVLIYDKNDVIVFASQQLLALLSVPKSFLAPGTRLRDFLGAVYDNGGRLCAEAPGSRRPPSRQAWIAEQIATLWKERADTLERREGDRWLSFAKRRLSSGYGVCVVKDVSDHKKREEQWRADMERVQITEEVLDNLPFQVTVKDRNLTFVAINKAACSFLDLPPEAVLGLKSSDIHPPELARRLEVVNRTVMETGESVQVAERVTRPDGSEMAIFVTKYRIGKPGRYYLVTAKEDITALVEGDQPGNVEPRIDPADLIYSSLKPHAADLEVGIPPATTAIAGRKVLVVSGDPVFEREALTMLGELRLDVSSVSGPEELMLFLRLAEDAGLCVDLVVVESGMQAQCLEIAAGYRINAWAMEADRTGIELATSLMRLLTGEAEPGRPVSDGANRDKVEIPPAPLPKASGIDILVAEDNEVNQIVFSQILEGFGYRYAIASDGEEAVRLWQEHFPRLILMDVTLPKLTGFEASARIRALETIDNSVPIIGVLAFAFDQDRDQCFASGMNDVILKPISPEALETVFETYLDEVAAISQFGG